MRTVLTYPSWHRPCRSTDNPDLHAHSFCISILYIRLTAIYTGLNVHIAAMSLFVNNSQCNTTRPDSATCTHLRCRLALSKSSSCASPSCNRRLQSRSAVGRTNSYSSTPCEGMPCVQWNQGRCNGAVELPTPMTHRASSLYHTHGPLTPTWFYPDTLRSALPHASWQALSPASCCAIHLTLRHWRCA